MGPTPSALDYYSQGRSNCFIFNCQAIGFVSPALKSVALRARVKDVACLPGVMKTCRRIPAPEGGGLGVPDADIRLEDANRVPPGCCYNVAGLIRKTFKYRLSDPSKAVAAKLDWVLWKLRTLYNDAMTERRLAYAMRGVSIIYYDQANQLPEIKEIEPDNREIGSHVLQDTLRRLDKAFAGFFRRVKQGRTPGFPPLVAAAPLLPPLIRKS